MQSKKYHLVPIEVRDLKEGDIVLSELDGKLHEINFVTPETGIAYYIMPGRGRMRMGRMLGKILVLRETEE